MDSEIIAKIDSLREQINIIDSNIKFNITIFVAMLALFLGLAGWALSLLVRSLVNKKVTEELEKTVRANPPILHLKGKAELVWERLDKGKTHCCLYVGMDTKNLKIESLEFPVEFGVYKKQKVTVPSVNLDGSLSDFKGETTIPVNPLYTEIRKDYVMVILEEEDRGMPSDDYYWTLKMPNPIFNEKE
jgi:hypothetical protein